MDVLADFLKTAGVTAQIDRSPYGGHVWTQSARTNPRPSGHACVKMVCVAKGKYSFGPERVDEPLLRGDIVFLLEGHPCSIEQLESDSTLITGSVIFQAGVLALETLKLPGASIVRGQDNAESMELAVRLGKEVEHARGGWEQVAVCLATSLFITALRASESCENRNGGGQGWLRSLADPEIGNAMRLMHEAPEYRWTVAELAERLSISRSAFAERFKKTTGRPPLDYLTWWRLQRAAARLRTGESSKLFELARDAGYQSEAAFSKAFRREFGISPGAARREAIAQQSTPSQLQLEIKKRNPFDSAEQEVSLNLVKSFESVRRPFEQLFGSYGLTGAEYNILRIMRGTNRPMPMDEVLDHLLIPHENVPHHIEQLGQKNYAQQNEHSGEWEITKAGKALLAKLDGPTQQLHRKQLTHFTADELSELNRLLVKFRSPVQ